MFSATHLLTKSNQQALTHTLQQVNEELSIGQTISPNIPQRAGWTGQKYSELHSNLHQTMAQARPDTRFD